MNKIFTLCVVGFVVMQSLVAKQLTGDVIEQKIDDLLEQMTLEEKVALCHAQSKFSTKGVPRLGVPELWMSDGPHGVRAEINWDDWGYAGWTNDSCTAFPALTCLASTFDPELSYAYGVAVGEEARFRKKDVLLGPGVNIYRTPLNGRNFEYLGEDPYLASTLVVPYIKGVQENDVAACVKHYALNNQEKWRGEVDVEVSDRALREIYLPAYEAAVKEGKVWSIMGAYNKYRGEHCCHNSVLLNKILKEEWAFDGVVISDWGGAHDTDQSALNGLDIEMGSMTDGLTVSKKYAYDHYYLAKPFLKKLRSGEISTRVVDDKARRILRTNLRTNMAPGRPQGAMSTKAHTDVARKVAQDGIVLLKNNHFFPLAFDGKIVAVIGENATRSMTIGGGSSELKARYEISPLEGLKARFPQADIRYAMGYSSGKSSYGKENPAPYNAEKLRLEAVALAKVADVVICVGGLNKNNRQDCEGADRKSMALPFEQEELLAALLEVNENVGVVLVSGNAVDMPWLTKVKGLMQAWYLGSEAGNAIADVISGDVNPSGKLPFTFPVSLADNSAHSFGEVSYPGIDKKQVYEDGILVGYRWHEAKKITPQFAFGFGLSYSTFDISDVKLNTKSVAENSCFVVTATVKNSGEAKGAEVVQVYVGKPKLEVARAPKELKGFAKVTLAAGETKTVEIEIEAAKLAYWSELESNWKIEKGHYVVSVGNASDHIVSKQKVKIE